MPVRPIPVTETGLIEIFSSIQGEGPLLGFRQLFIRFAQCNLDCSYCDTPFQPVPLCQVETAPGSETFEEWQNPITAQQIATLVNTWDKAHPGLHHSISLTGGEPLLHQEVLSDWLPQLKRKLPIYLETNGTLPDALEKLLPQLDYISMDIKLPSVAGQGALWDQHRVFLQLACQKQVFVKVVFSQQTPPEELEQAAMLVAETAPDVDLILQPCTGSEGLDLSPRELLVAQQRTAAIHPRTRVIPQTHTFMGVI